MAETIPTLKQNFLSAQVRLLSAPLAPSLDWHADAPPPSDSDAEDIPADDIPDAIVEAALAKANNALRKHHAAVYPPVALAHVARQIDALYRSAVSSSASAAPPPADPPLAPTADLRKPEAIAALPAEWPEPPDTTAPHARASTLETFDCGARYGKLRARLVALAEKREACRRAAARAKALRELAGGLREPGVNVQGSLVTRDGELRRELERLVVLCARLKGKVEAEGGVGDWGGGDGEDGMVTEEDMGMGIGRGMGKRVRA